MRMHGIHGLSYVRGAKTLFNVTSWTGHDDHAFAYILKPDEKYRIWVLGSGGSGNSNRNGSGGVGFLDVFLPSVLHLPVHGDIRPQWDIRVHPGRNQGPASYRGTSSSATLMMLGVTYGGYTGRDFYGATMATLEAGGGGGTWSGESGGGGGFELGLPNESVTRDYFEQEIMDFDMYYNVCKGRSTTIPWHADMDGAYWHANKQTNTQTFANTRDGSGSWAGTGGSTGVFTDVTSGLGQSNGKAVTLPAFAPAEVKACGYRGHWANEANTGGAVVLEGLSTGAAVLQDAVYVYNPCGWLMNY